MIEKKFRRIALSFLALIFFVFLSSQASAELVSDITVHTDANGEIDTVIKFEVPIQYLRHFPQGESDFTSIYFNILGNVPADVLNYESHRTPPSNVIRDITVSTRDHATGPKIQITFFRPAEFTVAMGRDNQTLLIHVKPTAPPENETKPAGGLPGAAVIPLATAPVAVPLAVPKPPVAAAAPSATTAATPSPGPGAAATPATKKPVAAAAAPVAPAGEITRPALVLAPPRSQPIHIPLGGKDGLPVFPAIDQPVPLRNIPPSEKPTLADEVTKANNQAGALMERGGNAILAGQTITAIESFNAVLALPPNKYTEDAQIWIGIARERSGQLPRAILEFNTYLRLYPDGKWAKWVRERLGALRRSQPALFAAMEKPAAPPRIQNTEYQYSEFGSLWMSYYQGASQINTTATGAAVQAPTSFSVTDQKSLMANVNVTARSYNNRFDHRFVFQDFYAANFLSGQQNSNRLGAAFYELNDRIADYSVRVGRQSGLGGGVMGRFDGVTAGYGFIPNWRANIVAGQLSDYTIDSKPTFVGASLDFGTRSPLGGSVYVINQRVSGITDRRAVGGNLRYFNQRFTLMSLLDYDVLFKSVNMVTVQGVLSGGLTGTDFNFLLDRRRSPILDVRNAINGTAVPFATLLQNGFTTSDLILLADQRTTISNLAQVGMTNHLNERWLIGTDFTIANTDGLAASGGLNDPVAGCIATEGCVAATPATGNTWTISERATGMSVIRPNDVTNFSVSYTKGKLTKAEAIQGSNHADLGEKWTLDSTFRIGFQSDNVGGRSTDVSPTVRATYKARSNVMIDTQLGLDWLKMTSSVLQSSTRSFREFVSLGFRLDF